MISHTVFKNLHSIILSQFGMDHSPHTRGNFHGNPSSHGSHAAFAGGKKTMSEMNPYRTVAECVKRCEGFVKLAPHMTEHDLCTLLHVLSLRHRNCTCMEVATYYTDHSCSARGKRTLFSAKSARTLAHFIL